MSEIYLRSIVRNKGRGRMGIGVELFRADAVGEEDLAVTEIEEIGSEKSSTAIMRIYEDIGEDFWTGGGITAKKFAQELDALGDIKRLNIHINCLGGDAFTAQAIHSIIADHPSKTTSYIDGVAASAATIIACAADEVIARHNTNYMIHYPWAMAVGNSEVLKKAAEDLDKLTIPLVSVYKEQVKGQISEEKIRDLMEKETWMSADEALEYGFVDKVRGKMQAIAKVSNTQIFCSGRVMNIAKYHYKNVPNFPEEEFPIEHMEAGVHSWGEPVGSKSKTENKQTMTVEELERHHPEIANTIRVAATTAERNRLAALDGMDAPGCETIIAKAKVEGKQPSDILLECNNILRDSLENISRMKALVRDAAPASAVPAGDAPIVRPEETKQQKGSKLLSKVLEERAKRSQAKLFNNGGK